MTPLAQGAAGLALALGFAGLATGRVRGAAMLCAAQAAVVAVAALAAGHVAVAALELAEAVFLSRLGGMPDRAYPPQVERFLARQPSQPPLHIPAILAAGAMLAALAATVPTTGPALGVILLGLLIVASRPTALQQALGIAAVQNGLVLAAVAADLSGQRLAVVVLPWLPALTFGALWLGSARARTAWLRAARPAAWIDFGLSATALLLACTLPWQLGAGGPLWRLDARAVHFILLLTALATASSWAGRRIMPIRGSRLAILAGTVVAVASCAPLLSWLGMTLATTGAVASALPKRAEVWQRLRLGCTGLGLVLFGTVVLLATTPSALAASACVVLGYGALAVLAPELTVAAVALILRVRGAPTDHLLLVAGLAALLIAALCLGTGRARRRMPGRAMQSAARGMTGVGRPATSFPAETRESRGWPAFAGHDTREGDDEAEGVGEAERLGLAGLAQAGAAVFAFGLGTEAGNLAGLLQLSFLGLTQCAVLLARQDGLDRLAAIAGLAGVPPFGLFPSIGLILAATADRLPWLLLPVGAGLAAVAWTVLLRLPSERRLLASPAWVPLALLLIAGFAMPDPLLAWFRLAAR